MPRISPYATAALLVVLAGCSSSTGSSGPSGSAESPAANQQAVPSGTAASSPVKTQEKPVPGENNPPGDIPDNIAFIKYVNTAGKYRFTHPEGWAEKTQGATVTFTDKLNGVQATVGSATDVPTVASAKQQDLPALESNQAAYELRGVTDVTVPAGRGVRIVYRRNSAPDPVTGRQYRDEVERYEIVAGGREVIVELFGPVGADNVDAYRTMITSLKIS